METCALCVCVFADWWGHRPTRKAQGNGDQEPEGDEGEEGAEGDGAGGASMPDEDVEGRQDEEGDAREEGRHPPCDAVPIVIVAVDQAPQPHAGGSRSHSQEQVHDQHGCQQGPPGRRRQKPCATTTRPLSSYIQQM